MIGTGGGIVLKYAVPSGGGCEMAFLQHEQQCLFQLLKPVSRRQIPRIHVAFVIVNDVTNCGTPDVLR